jgi:Holliday junction DNA helicase RuvB
LNVDAHGLDEMDNKILTTIIDKFKVGLDYLGLAASRETVEEVCTSPSLFRRVFSSREHEVEKLLKAYKHLGKIKSNIQGRFVLVLVALFQDLLRLVANAD